MPLPMIAIFMCIFASLFSARYLFNFEQAVATVNATYRWGESEARRVLREVLNAREQERRQEVTPPVACTRRTRSEGSDDDEGDDDDDANSVGAGAAA